MARRRDRNGDAHRCSVVAFGGQRTFADTPTASARPGSTAATSAGCRLGNGVQHVINITFDNVHFFRDNPNVPSDLEQMPTLYDFLKNQGVVLSNMHTPLIAHTAEDSLAIYSGLYGDRHGQPVSNSYKTYKPDGTTEPDTSFVYWNSPVINNTTKTPSTTDHAPSMVYSPTVPAAAGAPGQIAPEPGWAFNKAGCSVGAFSTANMVLENTGDIPTVFGSTPDLRQGTRTRQRVHRRGRALRPRRHGLQRRRRRGRRTPAGGEPAGLRDVQGLFGHKNIQPVLAARAHPPAPYRVADGAGNLVDLDNREIADFRGNVGFPGFSPTASQSLAEIADMQEAGVPVTYGYIADIHERKDWSFDCTTADATAFGNALGPGDACYTENAQRYDQAFAKFLDRLAKDGITPKNTLFVIGAEENDHLAGANVGRAEAPSDPANCDGVTTPCRYAAKQVGELQANLPQLLKARDRRHHRVRPRAAGRLALRHGQPGPADPQVRGLERGLARITGDNPYSGNPTSRS